MIISVRNICRARNDFRMGRHSGPRKTRTRMESVFDVVVQKLKNIRFPFGDAQVKQIVPII